MSNTRYTKLRTEDEGDGLKNRKSAAQAPAAGHDPRFDYEVEELVPWKSIALALFLLSLGTLLLVVSYLLFTKHMPGDSSQAWGALVLGVLVFLPGFYETRIAYYSWRGSPGYNFSNIPMY